MKKLILAAALLSLAPSFAQTAGQDMKNAGHDTVDATKKTGHKVKHGVKKGTHKAANKTAEGADKVSDKTAPK
jgi:hypothetical protein